MLCNVDSITVMDDACRERFMWLSLAVDTLRKIIAFKIVGGFLTPRACKDPIWKVARCTGAGRQEALGM